VNWSLASDFYGVCKLIWETTLLTRHLYTLHRFTRVVMLPCWWYYIQLLLSMEWITHGVSCNSMMEWERDYCRYTMSSSYSRSVLSIVAWWLDTTLKSDMMSSKHVGWFRYLIQIWEIPENKISSVLASLIVSNWIKKIWICLLQETRSQGLSRSISAYISDTG